MNDSGKILTHPKSNNFREDLVKIMLNKDWIRFRNSSGIIMRGWIKSVSEDSVTVVNPHQKETIRISQLVSVGMPETITGIEKQMELDWAKYRRKK